MKTTSTPFSILTTATVSVFVLNTLVGCGAAKSGFNTDPLAGKPQYKEMVRNGVPQHDQGPNRVEQVLVDPPAPPKSSEPEVPVAPAVPDVPPSPPVIYIPTVQVEIPAIPLPETQILNFVENQALRYELQVQDSKGSATISGLKGATFSTVEGSPDIYHVTWTPPVGASGSKSYSLSLVKLKVGASRQHNLIMSVSKEAASPLIEKIVFASASITAGEAVALKVLVKDEKAAAASELTLSVNPPPGASVASEKFAKSLVVKSAKKLGEGWFTFDLLLDSKDIEFAKSESSVRFFLGASRGGLNSPEIPQVIQVTPKAEKPVEKVQLEDQTTEVKVDPPTKPAKKKAASSKTGGQK